MEDRALLPDRSATDLASQPSHTPQAQDDRGVPELVLPDFREEAGFAVALQRVDDEVCDSVHSHALRCDVEPGHEREHHHRRKIRQNVVRQHLVVRVRLSVRVLAEFLHHHPGRLEREVADHVSCREATQVLPRWEGEIHESPRGVGGGYKVRYERPTSTIRCAEYMQRPRVGKTDIM